MVGLREGEGGAAGGGGGVADEFLCDGTGYSGRQGVYELLEMDAALTQAVSRSDPAEFIKLARERMRGQTMAHHVLELVRQGRTSLAEGLRIGFDMDD